MIEWISVWLWALSLIFSNSRNLANQKLTYSFSAHSHLYSFYLELKNKYLLFYVVVQQHLAAVNDRLSTVQRKKVNIATITFPKREKTRTAENFSTAKKNINSLIPQT